MIVALRTKRFEVCKTFIQGLGPQWIGAQRGIGGIHISRLKAEHEQPCHPVEEEGENQGQKEKEYFVISRHRR
jgi:hypothetical protein